MAWPTPAALQGMGSRGATAAVGLGSASGGSGRAAACGLAGWRGWGREGEGCQTDVPLPRRRPERPGGFRVGGRAAGAGGREGALPDVGPVSSRGQVQPGRLWRRPCFAPWL